MGGKYEREVWVRSMGGKYGWEVWVGSMGRKYGWERLLRAIKLRAIKG